jgi:hypothetical protein
MPPVGLEMDNESKDCFIFSDYTLLAAASGSEPFHNSLNG